MTRFALSVVVASYDRADGIRALLGDLRAQSLDAPFEVIVVDDGSTSPVAASLADAPRPAHTRVERIPNGGPGAARHHGAMCASGDVLLFVDDDMRVGPDFLAMHLAEHRAGPAPLVVYGTIAPAAGLDRMPLFERYHARMLGRFQDGVRAGRIRPRGVHCCTGNVSVTAAAYHAIGGFDRALRRSEDRDLGIRLQCHGAAFRVSETAVSTHASDHDDVAHWLARATTYGAADTLIAQRHPEVLDAHPWRFWEMMPRQARPLLALVLAFPVLGPLLSRTAFTIGTWCDRAGRGEMAVSLAAAAFAVEYFRGMRRQLGGIGRLRAFARSLHGAPMPSIVEDSPTAPAGAEPRGLLALIRADHDATRRQRAKYHGDVIPRWRLPVDLVTKVGLQMLAWMRLMSWLHARRVPLLPRLVSRLLRHFYSAEVHWRARIAPGVSIVHGTGLVLSHAARVGRGCILFQGVTLGESVDPVTGVVGAPTLAEDVHVGPGAVLLGPITIGRGSKIAAGVVLSQSVPEGSVVTLPPPIVRARRPRAAGIARRRVGT